LDYCENKDPYSRNPVVLVYKAFEHADELEHIDEEFPPDINETVRLLRELSESLELSRRDYEVMYKLYEGEKGSYITGLKTALDIFKKYDGMPRTFSYMQIEDKILKHDI